jgi:8-oxo-dGTP pyrophosphatase MutT (NUDIX family)
MAPLTLPDGLPFDLPFTIDAFGPFTSEQLSIRWSDAPRPTTPDLDARIADAWDRMFADCDRRGAMLFNGALIRYISHQCADGRLEVAAGPTNYRDFAGTNLLNGQLINDVGWDHFANPIGTTATVITSDGHLLYGRRNDRVAFHANHLHTIGGGLEDAERATDNTVDAFTSVCRELREELRLEESEIADLICLGLIHDLEIHQPELIFDASVALTRDQLFDRLDLNDAHQEHAAFEACADEPNAIAPFIQTAGLIAPVAVGALLLHGRHCWGDDWYHRITNSITAD